MLLAPSFCVLWEIGTLALSTFHFPPVFPSSLLSEPAGVLDEHVVQALAPYCIICLLAPLLDRRIHTMDGYMHEHALAHKSSSS